VAVAVAVLVVKAVLVVVVVTVMTEVVVNAVAAAVASGGVLSSSGSHSFSDYGSRGGDIRVTSAVASLDGNASCHTYRLNSQPHSHTCHSSLSLKHPTSRSHKSHKPTPVAQT
jgi:hypothetical protein